MTKKKIVVVLFCLMVSSKTHATSCSHISERVIAADNLFVAVFADPKLSRNANDVSGNFIVHFDVLESLKGDASRIPYMEFKPSYLFPEIPIRYKQKYIIAAPDGPMPWSMCLLWFHHDWFLHDQCNLYLLRKMVGKHPDTIIRCEFVFATQSIVEKGVELYSRYQRMKNKFLTLVGQAY